MHTSIYEAAGGWPGMLALADAWHQRVMADEVVEHAFSHGYRSDHTERLAAYWAEALGGPPMWSELGEDETSVVRVHAGNGPHEEMDQHSIMCFDEAVSDVGLDSDPEVAEALRQYWRWAVGNMNHHGPPETVPEGMPVAQWGWDGPATERQ